jgi:glyoxylase-like metal-dependent hydrolase (beta-lactamase superfamily II)
VARHVDTDTRPWTPRTVRRHRDQPEDTGTSTRAETRDTERNGTVEVARDVHRIETPLGERINCLYLLAGAEAGLLFDTGIDPTVREALPAYLDDIGFDPARIRFVVNSHCDWDHTGGNGAVRELAPNALLMCHELDRPRIEDLDRLIDERYGEFRDDHGIDEPDETKAFIHDNARVVPIDVGLRGGEVLHLGDGWRVEVMHTPGHSWGHVSIHDPRSRSVAIGDATLWNAVLFADGSPAFPPTYRYVDTYLATIHRFQGMELDRVLTSHYPVYAGDQVGEFLAESRAYVDRVDAALSAALRDTPRTMRELTEELGDDLGAWPKEAHEYLVHPFGGHLERFEQHGDVERERGDGHVVHRWVGA